ncbi:MAG: flavodoxin domain-containing protein [Actinomycetota bacterium]
MSGLRLLVVFHSGEGHTAAVAERIGATIGETGATVEVVGADRAPGPEGFDGVLVGGAIHFGRHGSPLRRYLERHGSALATMPLAVFQVSLTSATDDDEHRATAHQLLADLIDPAGLDPDVVGFFAGSLAYTRYGWLKRRLMRTIARGEGVDTDTDADHDYTDWDAVEQFALDAVAAAQQAKHPGPRRALPS